LESILTFHLACIKAEENDVATSLTMLSQAVDLGFPDLAQIKENKALESVRALPNFAETMTAWEKTQRERILEAGRAAIVNGESFPFTFDLKDVEGNPIRLSDYKGKVCIVDIWGTWCGPCVMEIPSFIKLQNEFEDRGFQMIGLNKENSPPESATPMVRQFIATHGINYPCALIDEGILRQIPQLEGYPTTLFIDHEGKVRAKLVGVHPHDKLESMVLALIEERDSASAPTQSN
jgi:thiol-disulfide isomerase/thioredoxin